MGRPVSEGANLLGNLITSVPAGLFWQYLFEIPLHFFVAAWFRGCVLLAPYKTMCIFRSSGYQGILFVNCACTMGFRRSSRATEGFLVAGGVAITCHAFGWALHEVSTGWCPLVGARDMVQSGAH